MYDGGLRNMYKGYGEGYGSYRFFNAHNEEIYHRVTEHGDIMSSNTAEYATLIEALTEILRYCAARNINSQSVSLFIEGDSMLVIRQIGHKDTEWHSNWKCKKPHLEILRNKARSLLDNFAGFEYNWISRKLVVAELGH